MDQLIKSIFQGSLSLLIMVLIVMVTVHLVKVAFSLWSSIGQRNDNRADNLTNLYIEIKSQIFVDNKLDYERLLNVYNIDIYHKFLTHYRPLRRSQIQHEIQGLYDLLEETSKIENVHQITESKRKRIIALSEYIVANNQGQRP